MANIKYTSKELINFYSNNRVSWDEIYDSEKYIFNKVFKDRELSILDVGCACGGMGRALNEKFNLKSYTGVEINSDCAAFAKNVFPKGEYICADFLEIESQEKRKFSDVLSMSCADWNIETESMFQAMFKKVENDGYLIFSCRLNSLGKDIEARQYISLGNPNATNCESAPYKVFSFSSLMKLIFSFQPKGKVIAYGYKGKVPDSVYNLPLSEVFYAVLAVQKSSSDKSEMILEGFDELWN